MSVFREDFGLNLTGNSKWRGGVLAGNGKIYAMPYDANDFLVIDPANESAVRTNLGATLSGGNNKFAGGVYVDSGGFVLGVGHLGLPSLRIQLPTETVTFSAGSGSFRYYSGAVYVPSNEATYFLPYDNLSFAIFRWSGSAYVSSTATLGLTLTDTAKWSDGVFDPDDEKIYGIPFNSTTIVVITPASNPLSSTAIRTNMGASLSGTAKWMGGVRAPNGLIFGVPYDAEDILIIDPVSGVAERDDLGEDLSGSAKWAGAAVGADGLIYCFPFNAEDILVIDPENLTAVRDDFGLSLSGNGKWWGGVRGPDGRIYAIPHSATDLLIIGDPIEPDDPESVDNKAEVEINQYASTPNPVEVILNQYAAASNLVDVVLDQYQTCMKFPAYNQAVVEAYQYTKASNLVDTEIAYHDIADNLADIQIEQDSQWGNQIDVQLVQPGVYENQAEATLVQYTTDHENKADIELVQRVEFDNLIDVELENWAEADNLADVKITQYTTDHENLVSVEIITRLCILNSVEIELRQPDGVQSTFVETLIDQYTSASTFADSLLDQPVHVQNLVDVGLEITTSIGNLVDVILDKTVRSSTLVDLLLGWGVYNNYAQAVIFQTPSARNMVNVVLEHKFFFELYQLEEAPWSGLTDIDGEFAWQGAFDDDL